MALYRYLKLADDVLPSLTEDLSSSISPTTIKGRSNSSLNVKIKTAKIKTAKISSGGETGFS